MSCLFNMHIFIFAALKEITYVDEKGGENIKNKT
jgi:hypothetical protein